MSTAPDTDPINIWIHLLRKNKLPDAAVNQLADAARQWLRLLYDDPQLTPVLARDQVLQKITDSQTQDFFARYFFALFVLLRESALTT